MGEGHRMRVNRYFNISTYRHLRFPRNPYEFSNSCIYQKKKKNYPLKYEGLLAAGFRETNIDLKSINPGTYLQLETECKSINVFRYQIFDQIYVDLFSFFQKKKNFHHR